MNNSKTKYIVFSLFIVFLFTACKKDYYVDTGVHNGVLPYSSLEFLKRTPFYFDSVVQIIQLAEMESVIEDSTITFFSPTDHAVAKAMDLMNSNRHEKFQDSLRLDQVPGVVWRKFLSRYIFEGKYMLKDVGRRDPAQLNVYPGMNIESWNGYIMNIGVLFSNYEGTKDVGPRRLTITEIDDLGQPKNISSNVATSDLQTKNGIIHILVDSHTFGFNASDFSLEVERYIY